MTTLTVETSFQFSPRDMGDSHIQIHKNQHSFLQKGESLVEELTDTKTSDDALTLAIDKLQELGVRNEQEWKEYNSKLAKSRRKNTYLEYLQSLGSPMIKAKEHAMQKEKTPDATKTKLAREIGTIKKQNHGIPMHSMLFYVGSADDYIGKKPDEVAKLRKARGEAIEGLFKDPQFLARHPGLFWGELHNDELGEKHGQAGEVLIHIDKRGRVGFNTHAALRDNLIASMGKQEFEDSLNLLCYAHDQCKREKGKTRADLAYIAMKQDGYMPPASELTKFSHAEKKARLAELVRVEDMECLIAHAGMAYHKHGLKLNLDSTYTTDGDHLTRYEYRKQHQKRVKLAALDAQVNDSQQRLDDTTKAVQTASDDLTELNKTIKQKKDDKKKLDSDLDDTQQSVDALQQQQDVATKQLQQVQDNIKQLKEDENQRKQRIKRLDNQIEHKQGLLDDVEDRLNAANKRLKQVERNIQSNFYRKAFKLVYHVMLALTAAHYKKPAPDLKKVDYDQAALDIASGRPGVKDNQERLNKIEADALAATPQPKQSKTKPKKSPKSEPKKPTDDELQF